MEQFYKNKDFGLQLKWGFSRITILRIMKNLLKLKLLSFFKLILMSYDMTILVDKHLFLS